MLCLNHGRCLLLNRELRIVSKNKDASVSQEPSLSEIFCEIWIWQEYLRDWVLRWKVNSQRSQPWPRSWRRLRWRCGYHPETRVCPQRPPAWTAGSAPDTRTAQHEHRTQQKHTWSEERGLNTCRTMVSLGLSILLLDPNVIYGVRACVCACVRAERVNQSLSKPYINFNFSISYA